MTLPSDFMNATSTAVPSIKPQTPYWYWAISGTLSVLTVVGNGLVIYLITTKRNLHITGNWFVLSLAFADFFCGLFVQPISFLCSIAFTCNRKVLLTFYNILMSLSVYNTFLMTLDRYISIVYPLKYAEFMNTRRVMFAVCTAWIVPIVLSVLPFTWSTSRDVTTANQVHTASMLVLIEFFLPVVLVGMYFRLLLTVRRHRRQTAIQLAQLSFNRMTVPRARPKKHDRSIKVIGTVVTLFVLCYALDIYKSICQRFAACKMAYETVLVSTLLVYLNSAVNPVVYALLKRDIRYTLRKLFRCRARGIEGQGMTTRNEMTDMDYSLTVG